MGERAPGDNFGRSNISGPRYKTDEQRGEPQERQREQQKASGRWASGVRWWGGGSLGVVRSKKSSRRIRWKRLIAR